MLLYCPVSSYYSPDLIATARSDCLQQRAGAHCSIGLSTAGGWITSTRHSAAGGLPCCPLSFSPDLIATARLSTAASRGTLLDRTAAGWTTSTGHSAAGRLPCYPLSLYYSPDLIATARLSTSAPAGWGTSPLQCAADGLLHRPFSADRLLHCPLSDSTVMSW